MLNELEIKHFPKPLAISPPGITQASFGVLPVASPRLAFSLVRHSHTKMVAWMMVNLPSQVHSLSRLCLASHWRSPARAQTQFAFFGGRWGRCRGAPLPRGQVQQWSGGAGAVEAGLQAATRSARAPAWNSHCSRSTRNVVAVVQLAKGSGNGEGSKAPASTGYQNTISLPG